MGWQERTIGACVGLALTCAAGSASASPEDLFGYGGRSSAMGATGAAHARGFEAAYANPALLGARMKSKLTLGMLGATFRLDAAGPGLPGRLSTERARGFFIGADLPLPLGGKLRDRVGLGLAFYTPSDVIVRGRALYPERPQFVVLGDRAQSVTLRAGLGANLGYGLRLGVGFAALAEIVGTVVAATDATGRVGTRVEDQLVATYAPAIGASYDLPGGGDATYRLGLSFRGKLDARFAVLVDGSKLSSIAIPVFNIAGLAQYDPAQIVAEVARVRKGNTIAIGAVYKRWGDYPGPLEPTVLCSDGGTDCGLSPPKIAFRDVVSVRVGAEQHVTVTPSLDLALRAGAFFETSPVPSELPVSQAYDGASRGVSTVPTRYFDAARVAATFGAGLAGKRPLPPVTFDIFTQVQSLVGRDIGSTDASFAPAQISGQVLVFGALAGVSF